MTRRALALILLSLFLLPRLHARVVENVMLEETKTVGGKELKLNGAGIRTATMLKVKVYVAAFYSHTPVSTAEEALKLEGPLRFDFTFMRAFGQNKVREAWEFTFKESADYKYPDFDRDAKKFGEAFGAIRKGGVETVEIVGDTTKIYDDNVLKGEFKGRDFQKAFLSLWFGSKPVMPSLKAQLLGQTK